MCIGLSKCGSPGWSQIDVTLCILVCKGHLSIPRTASKWHVVQRSINVVGVGTKESRNNYTRPNWLLCCTAYTLHCRSEKLLTKISLIQVKDSLISKKLTPVEKTLEINHLLSVLGDECCGCILVLSISILWTAVVISCLWWGCLFSHTVQMLPISTVGT